MLNNFIPPEETYFPEKFLTKEGLSRSIGLLSKGVDGNVNNILDNPEFKVTDIYWLVREIKYKLTYSGIESIEEYKKIENYCDEILSGKLDYSGEFLKFLIDTISRMGEEHYKNMLSFENGAIEGDCGNNQLYQSSQLQEYILIGIRLGMNKRLLEKWKEKLRDQDKSELEESIFPIIQMPNSLKEVL